MHTHTEQAPNFFATAYPDLYAEYEVLLSQMEMEDDTPVDNIISERQQRLLVEALYASWKPSEPFVALANVGLFFALRQPPLVPDMLLSVGVAPPPNLSEYLDKSKRAYLTWEYAKPPDLVLEVVSNLKGGELDEKLTRYAALGIEYYVVFDPLQQYGKPIVRVFVRRSRQYEQIDEAVFPDIGLRLEIWEGTYQGIAGGWLRWFTMDGTLLATGEELDTLLTAERERTTTAEARATTAEARATTAEARAEALAAKLRALGIDP
jgi:Uma2 family endonuclease